MDLYFTKMHGLGNDFIVVDSVDQDIQFSPDAVEWVCHRNFGIGADGLIILRRPSSEAADFSWDFFNADGTKAEMCGNGARCFAKYVADQEMVAPEATSVRLETLAGVVDIRIDRGEDGSFRSATVDMGEPVLDPQRIPASFSGNMVYDCPIETAEGTFRVTAVSMGNPHAVLWVDDVFEAPVETVGPTLETDEHFPNRTNVEFAQLLDGERIRLRVWERGVGETLACGTGACATLVAAVLACKTGREATIEVPGGEMTVRWDEDEHVYLTGPARTVFSGTLELGDG